MDRLNEHIERLLFKHDCVIIPDFGGFVIQGVPAVYDSEEHSFTPSRKEIVFNPTLTHNDGLLVESYMKEYSADFSKAQALVKKDVSEMKASLDENLEMQLVSIGRFVKKGDRLIFSPDENSGALFSTASYGLPTFHYLPLTARGLVPALQKEAEPAAANVGKQSGDGTIYIPITRNFVRTVAATAAAILLFLLVATPVREVNKASYSASFVPQEMMPKTTATDSASNAFEVAADTSQYAKEPALADTNADSAASEIETEKETTSPAFAETPSPSQAETTEKPENAPKENPETKPATNSSSMKHYVIIGSFDTQKKAGAYIKMLDGEEAATAGIVVCDEHVRVYADVFESENDALSYLSEIRKKTQHKQAWIYKGK